MQTSFVPDKEQYNVTRAQLLAQMDVAMGGRVAEELVYGADQVTTGKVWAMAFFLCGWSLTLLTSCENLHIEMSGYEYSPGGTAI